MIVREQTRPDIGVHFFNFAEGTSEEFKQYFHDTYKVSGLLISSNILISDDKLTITTTQHWKDRDSYLNFLCDPKIYESLYLVISDYNREHKIKSDIISMEEI
jgi:hypothetical protein